VLSIEKYGNFNETQFVGREGIMSSARLDPFRANADSNDVERDMILVF
jgi:hypothetical protein